MTLRQLAEQISRLPANVQDEMAAVYDPHFDEYLPVLALSGEHLGEPLSDDNDGRHFLVVDEHSF